MPFSPRRWVLGLSAATAAIVAFFYAAVLPRSTEPLVDGDVWWHIRAGEEILRGGRVPDHDTWSIVAPGTPWTSQDWFANVVLALGHRLGPWGDTGLSLLFGAMTVLAFWILWRGIELRERRIGWASRIVWLSFGLLLAGPVLGVRVQVFDLLLSAATLWLLWRYLVDPRRRWLAGLPLIALAWANLHAGWLLLFMLGLAVLAGEGFDRIARRTTDARPSLTWPQLRDLALSLIASALAISVNPNGLELYAYPFYTLSITALRGYVQEWSPASLGTLFGWLLLGFTVAGVLPVLLFARSRVRTADVLMLLGLTLLAWRGIRFLLITGPIGAAIIAVALSPVIWNSGTGRAISPTFVRLSRPRTGRLARVNAGLAVGVLILGIGISVSRVNPAAQAAEIAREMPVGAVTWMDEHDAGTRIFNRYEWGGYIGLSRPDRPIFMDGRADVYGDALLYQYISVIGLSVDPQTVFDRYQIDHIVIPPDWALARWLDGSPAWRRVYADSVAAVWVRH